jgi:radical SAM protein with 4Fe4S-binding SPASM domain
MNMREFESGATVLRSRPRVLFVELTENCNLSCPMCRSSGAFERGKNMSPELFDQFAAELFPTAEIVDLRGWGESSILKRFPDFVAKTHSYGCRVRLVTNLTVTNDELWRDLVRNRALIVVSLDAARQDTLQTLRTGSKLATIVRNLEIMVDEGVSSGVGTDGIHLNVVVQAAALDELNELVRLAARLGLRVHLNPVTLGHDDPDNLRYHQEKLSTAIRAAAVAADDAGVEVRLNAALDEDWAVQAHAAKTCSHPWMYCYLNHRGQIGFCDHLIGVPGTAYLLGDLNATNFEDIWNGPSYQDLRAQHAHWDRGISDRFEECNWCYRNRYVDFDEESYPPYAAHTVRLAEATCPVLTNPRSVPSPAGPHHRMLPIVDTGTRRLDD